MKQTNEITSTHISDFFIKIANENGSMITQLKLQKLLYYAYFWKLILNNKKIFNNEIEAWKHGPVVVDEWKRINEYGKDLLLIDVIQTNLDLLSAELKNYLNTIWHAYGKYEGWALVERTHSELPWIIANDLNTKKKIITDELIKKCYDIEKSYNLLPEHTVITKNNEGNYILAVFNDVMIKAMNTHENEYEDFIDF